MEKTVRVYRLVVFGRVVFCSNRVIGKCQTNVLVKDIEINNCSYMKRRTVAQTKTEAVSYSWVKMGLKL